MQCTDNSNLVSSIQIPLQGGEHTWDAFSCRSLSATEPLFVGLFCGKWRIDVWHPVHLCHPVYIDWLGPCLWGLGFRVYSVIYPISSQRSPNETNARDRHSYNMYGKRLICLKRHRSTVPRLHWSKAGTSETQGMYHLSKHIFTYTYEYVNVYVVFCKSFLRIDSLFCSFGSACIRTPPFS